MKPNELKYSKLRPNCIMLSPKHEAVAKSVSAKYGKNRNKRITISNGIQRLLEMYEKKYDVKIE